MEASKINHSYLLIQDENPAFWKDLIGTHPYNPDPAESKVRAGGLVGEEMEREAEESRSDGEHSYLEI